MLIAVLNFGSFIGLSFSFFCKNRALVQPNMFHTHTLALLPLVKRQGQVEDGQA